MKIVYIARSDGTDMRVSKTCNSLVRLGHEVVFVGWDREPQKQKVNILHPDVRQRILKRPAKIGNGSIVGFSSYLRHACSVVCSEKPDVVHAVNEDGALIVLVMKSWCFRFLVLDVFDSIIANPGKGYVNQGLRKGIRWVANASADRIIETWDTLQDTLGRWKQKSVVIANCPHDPGEGLSQSVPNGDAVTVCIGGTLSRVRDQLDILLKAVEACPRGSVRVQASGWLRDEYAREVFARSCHVEYSWLDTPEDFLRAASRSDALLYLRGDADESEYRACVVPNRLFDAMAVGRPIIINGNLRISEWVEARQLGYVWQAGDVDALKTLMLSLKEQRPQLPEFAKKSRALFLREWTWLMMEKRLQKLYESLSVA